MYQFKSVYKYKCDICNNVYIGKTKRYLIVRQYEHLDKTIASDKPLGTVIKMPLLLESTVTA